MMHSLALTSMLIAALAIGLAGCGRQDTGGTAASAAASQSQRAFEGTWVGASGTTLVTVRAIGGNEFEFKSTVIMDRKDRRFDQVRTHVAQMVGRQFLIGGLQLAALDAQDQLVWSGHALQRSASTTSSGGQP